MNPAGVFARFLAISLALPLLAAAASSSPRTTGAAFLQQSVSARAAAMGDANTAWADDVYGMWFNPAGIAVAERKQIGFQYNSYMLDMSHNYLGYLHPFRQGAVGVTIQYVDLGTVERTTVQNGAAVRNGNASANDLAFGVTYARTVGRSLDLGVTAKLINEHLDNYSASAFAVDLGAKWRPPVAGLTLGAAVQNLGSSLKFVRENEQLPLSLRLGAGYRPVSANWGVAADVDYTRGQELGGHVGGEYWLWNQHIVLRGGFTSTSDAGTGATVGAGFRWNDLQLDYAYRPNGDLGDQQQVGLSYEFGVASKRLEAESFRARTDESHAPIWQKRQRRGVYVGAFSCRLADNGDAWLGNATTVVLRDRLGKKGELTEDQEAARYAITGDWFVSGGEFLLVTKMTDLTGQSPDRMATARGDADAPFTVWDQLIKTLWSE